MTEEKGIGISCCEIKWTLTQVQMHRFFVALAEQARFVLPQNDKSEGTWGEMAEGRAAPTAKAGASLRSA